LATKSFFGRGFAAAADAMQYFGSVNIATGDSAIAVPRVAARRGFDRDAVPTAGTSGAPRADWIIATGNARIGGAGSKLA
jgi:hypothetical protein